MKLDQLVRDNAPAVVHEAAIALYNARLYRQRRGPGFNESVQEFNRVRAMSGAGRRIYAERRLEQFLRHASASPFHEERFRSVGFEDPRSQEVGTLPLMSKSDLVQHLEAIRSPRLRGAPLVSYTGGTTGASTKVYYDQRDVIERQAFLEIFRSEHGWRRGMPTAWFSGKDLLSERDRRAGRLWKWDRLQKILYVSTFDINAKTAPLIWDEIVRREVSCMVGFPSSMLQLMAGNPEILGGIGVIFPTAEVVTDHFRTVASDILGARVADQYASSEGAPFITECGAGSLHLREETGLFEVIDSDGRPSDEGEMVVTPFHTRGTPLVRYRIGDRVQLRPGEWMCPCGLEGRVAAELHGRAGDFAIASDGTEINLGNLSNATKGVSGIVKFQVHQAEAGSAKVLVESTRSFDARARELFIQQLAARFGESTRLELEECEVIPLAPSGKFRLVVKESAGRAG